MKHGKPHDRMSYLPVVIILLAIATTVFVFFISEPRPNPAIALDSLNKLQEKSVEIIVETNKLIVSLSLLIIGAVGGFSLQKYSGINIRTSFQKTIVVSCVGFASLAIFFGYFRYVKMVEMLSNSMFDPESSLIAWPQGFQFICFFLSVSMFGILVFSSVISSSPPTESLEKCKNETQDETEK